jgi:class 3 adenylate cyclase
MSNVVRRYSSLEDFLASVELTVDGELDSGRGVPFPVKGREVHAPVLFCDMSGFSNRSQGLTPTETLAFVNNFFSWITAESIRNSRGIIDKYIGDEVMILFAREFGSDDPFADALRAARWMIERDVHAFCPHIGVASGPVTIGYVGTPLRYNCSAFGAPVTLAARCAGVKPEDPPSSWITFPAAEWENRDLGAVSSSRGHLAGRVAAQQTAVLAS